MKAPNHINSETKARVILEMGYYSFNVATFFIKTEIGKHFKDKTTEHIQSALLDIFLCIQEKTFSQIQIIFAYFTQAVSMEAFSFSTQIKLFIITHIVCLCLSSSAKEIQNPLFS